MKPIQLVRVATDVLMTAVLLLLMAYSMVGEAVHEWLGIGMFALLILHHVLNNKWCRNMFKGKYTPFRVVQTALVVLVMAAMLGSIISGIILSHYALSFLQITSGRSWARRLHLLCAYWGFAFMSLHLGLHWNMMMGMAKKMFKKPSAVRAWLVKGVGFLIAGYGVYAFIKREIGSYMTLRNQFAFFDFDESLVYFLLDYVAIMGLFVFAGYYFSEGLKCLPKCKKRN